jgi:hypothetical protein
MTKQVYRTAQGNSIDLGTIKLRNGHVRAVGNMGVNARGDVLDSTNTVIDTKSRQIQRQNAQLTNVVDTPMHTSSAAARRARAQETADPVPVYDIVDTIVAEPTPVDDSITADTVDNTPTVEEISTTDNSAPVVAETPAVSDPLPATIPATGGGLAAAIARSKIVKQEKEKTARQQLQSTPGVRKI